jgi:hypothetical protein
VHITHLNNARDVSFDSALPVSHVVEQVACDLHNAGD